MATREALAALVPGAILLALPIALLAVARPRRPKRTRTRTLITRVLCVIVLLAGFGGGTASWGAVLLTIALTTDDLRAWPAAFAPTVLGMIVIGAVLHQGILLGLAREARDDVRAVTSTEAP